MSKNTKIWILAAASLVLLGGIIFVCVMTELGWNFEGLSTVRYETNTYEINEGYEKISIVTDTADVIFLPSQDGKTSVVCFEEEKVRHSVEVADGTLTVKAVDTRKWYEHIGINFRSPKITVYLPSSDYGPLTVRTVTGDVTLPKDFIFSSIDVSVSTGDVRSCASAWGNVKIETTTGDIKIENISAASLCLSVTTGDVNASKVTCDEDIRLKVSTGRAKVSETTCQSLATEGSTGDVILSGVVVKGMLSAERSTGDIKLDGCDAGEIYIKTNTGDVSGSLLSGKEFFVRSTTGSINAPDSTVGGGRCQITTTTGSIKITVK